MINLETITISSMNYHLSMRVSESKSIELISVIPDINLDDFNNSSKDKTHMTNLFSLVNNHFRGDLFLEFIRSDFSSVEGLASFSAKFGINGLLDFTESTLEIHSILKTPNTARESISTYLLKNFYQSVLDCSSSQLEDAKGLFAGILDNYLSFKSLPQNESKSSLEIYYSSISSDLHQKILGLSGPVVLLYDQDHKESKRTKPEYARTYITSNILTATFHDFFLTLENSSFNTCKICGAVFTPHTRVAELYCDSCKNANYETKVQDNPISHIFIKTYKIRHSEKQRKIKKLKSIDAPEALINLWENSLSNWTDFAKSKQEEVEQGKISLDEFQEEISLKLEDIVNGVHRKKR